MLLGQFIPLHYHFNMLLDPSRMNSFREAIELVVPVGGTVLELGGGTGVLSFFAAQRASKVWCVERNPALVRAARTFLSNNPGGERVEVVPSDAMCYLPPAPVDIVICEMLHVAMIREKQLEVLQSFAQRYLDRFGPPLPTFLPDASVLALQLIDQDYNFSGYIAPVPLFTAPGSVPVGSIRTDLQVYQSICYDQSIPDRFDWQGRADVVREGRINAISFFTKNFLAYVHHEQRGIEWTMNQLILPLTHEIDVQKGDTLSIKLSYPSGCPIETLQQSMCVKCETRSWQRRLAA